ncbi:hypothetical protein BDW74DRAFT_176338 [Aspergillus multicolor]|uniref:uncharacterized protein n=1 Tax=Aspergillus multicolor TaxID=41759 RepID=UPI003CCE07A0
MQHDGFAKWGFVVYRCTYTSDAEWEVFMNRLHSSVERYLTRCNGLDMLESFAPTVMQDPSFNGASMDTLRAHFRSWSSDAFCTKNPNPAKGSFPVVEEASRYRLFIAVDDESLRSVYERPFNASYSLDESGYARLANGQWNPHEDDEDGGRVVGEDEELEPIDGWGLENVGWMKVRYDNAQLLGYYQITRFMDFDRYHERPHAIVRIV